MYLLSNYYSLRLIPGWQHIYWSCFAVEGSLWFQTKQPFTERNPASGCPWFILSLTLVDANTLSLIGLWLQIHIRQHELCLKWITMIVCLHTEAWDSAYYRKKHLLMVIDRLIVSAVLVAHTPMIRHHTVY